ncbi:hypothetical protein RM533_13280 [Croceicoccus sp. F390]|uniref:Uncharacterized protein n=1 Tax=Croceicoccus esteveae TaxID=3075597 RepID=A0ABU2ZKK7_9SPHN|nr:hypothetical protein [Croceicoccus sp. F390]MDT0577138.1 hypothetical protein [Croceicoccus sp. F390]
MGKGIEALTDEMREPDLLPFPLHFRQSDQALGYGGLSTRKRVKAPTAPLVHATGRIGEWLKWKGQVLGMRDRFHALNMPSTG